MGNSRRVNDFVYDKFRDTFFNRFTHIHCPSNNGTIVILALR